MVNDQEPIVALEEMEKMADAKSMNTQVVVSTNLSLALHDRKKTTAVEAGGVACHQVTPNKRTAVPRPVVCCCIVI